METVSTIEQLEWILTKITPFFPQIFWFRHGSILSAMREMHVCVLNNNSKIANNDFGAVYVHELRCHWILPENYGANFINWMRQ